MTVVRRELPLSSSASHLQREPGRRLVQARTLQSCPHRRDVEASQEAHGCDWFTPLGHRAGVQAIAGHGGPDEADQFAGDGRDGNGGALAVSDEMAIAAMQPLLSGPGFSTTPGGCPALWRAGRPLTVGRWR